MVPFALHPRTMLLLVFAAIVIGVTLSVRLLRLDERIRGLSPKGGSRLLAILWVGALALVTGVIVLAPPDDGSRQSPAIKAIVIAICWLIAVFSFTPLGKRWRDRKLLPEKAARIAAVALLFLILAAFLVAAVVAGGGMVGIIVASVVILVGWHAGRDWLKARQGHRRKRKHQNRQP